MIIFVCFLTIVSIISQDIGLDELRKRLVASIVANNAAEVHELLSFPVDPNFFDTNGVFYPPSSSIFIAKV